VNLKQAMKLNLNAKVRVKLTVTGLGKVLMEDGAAHMVIKSDGTWECQLWELMRAVGPHLWNGQRPLFMNNDIEVIDDG